MRKLPIGPDVDARVIARGTPGFSGADLSNLANEAALTAARKNRKKITKEMLENHRVLLLDLYNFGECRVGSRDYLWSLMLGTTCAVMLNAIMRIGVRQRRQFLPARS